MTTNYCILWLFIVNVRYTLFIVSVRYTYYDYSLLIWLLLDTSLFYWWLVTTHTSLSVKKWSHWDITHSFRSWRYPFIVHRMWWFISLLNILREKLLLLVIIKMLDVHTWLGIINQYYYCCSVMLWLQICRLTLHITWHYITH